METKAHYALIGFFVISVLGLAVVFVIWLSQTSLNQQFSEYDVVFQGPVSGLSTASEVRFNGIKVGEVSGVRVDEFDTSNVVARIRVDANTPVKADSIARLEPQGITGLAYVQIEAGSRDAPEPLLSGDLDVPRIESEQGQLDVLFEGANTAFLRANAALSDQNLENLAEIIDNLRALSEELSANREVIVQARQAVTRLNTASERINEAADAFLALSEDGRRLLNTQLTTTLLQTEEAARDVEIAAENFNLFIETLQPPVNDFAATGLPNIGLAAADIRRVTEVLERIALDVESDAGAFLSGSARPETEIDP